MARKSDVSSEILAAHEAVLDARKYAPGAGAVVAGMPGGESRWIVTPAEIGTAVAGFVTMRARGELPHAVDAAWEPVECQLDELRRCDEELERAMGGLKARPHDEQSEREVAGLLEGWVERDPVVGERLERGLRIVDAELERVRAERDPTVPGQVLHVAFSVGRGRVPPALDLERSRDPNQSRDRGR